MSLRLDFMPWDYRDTATDDDRLAQAGRHRELSEQGDVAIAADAYLAHSAAIFCDRLVVGERSYIAAHAYITGEVVLGADTTINPFTTVRGQVTLGDGVRVGAHTSLLGFNHGAAPDEPIFHQPLSSIGITIGDNVWIGSNVVVLDGVSIGSHAIVGAGAVVTKDVEEWAVVVGNPARKVRDRRRSSPASQPASSRPELGSRLAAFADRARSQVESVLRRCYDGSAFVDSPGGGLAVRPWCDAIEIADLLTGATPLGLEREELAERLRSSQDPVTGLVPGHDGSVLSPFADPASYHILCVGYALRLLGSRFAHPIRAVHDLGSEELERRLASLDWATGAWGAGHIVDGLATATLHNMLDFPDSFSGGGRGSLATLVGWLSLQCSPTTGMWGDLSRGSLEVVNGFYRITRGVHAQFGLPLPYPSEAVGTVLAHARGQVEPNACNILDIIHPLWLAGQQTDAHQDEGRWWASEQLDRALGHWVDGEGFAFAPGSTPAPHGAPGLQGTEMWLAIIWLLADYLGLAPSLGYRPRGVHRPEPALPLAP